MMVSNQKVKALLFTLILAFIAIGTIAVAAVMKNEKPVEVSKKAVVMDTWYFQGGDASNPDNYGADEVEGKPCDEAEEVICQIYAPADSFGRPNMSATVPNTTPTKTVGQQIAEAVANPHTNETVISLREE